MSVQRRRWTSGWVAAAILIVAGVRVFGMADTAKLDKSAIVITSPDDFTKEVEGRAGVVLVDFWATWCGPCKYMNPIIAELAKKHEGRLTVAKVDVDKNNELAARYKVSGIPTFIIFKDGKDVDMHIGAMPKEAFAAWVEKYLEATPIPAGSPGGAPSQG